MGKDLPKAKLVLSALPLSIYLSLYRSYYKLARPEHFKWLQEVRRTVTDDGYSFRPFDETGSIFVHIPKCAGVSICRALYGNLAGGHATVREYMAAFEPRRFLSYFKFTIVRNPWDRVVSAYHYLKNGGMNESDRAWSAEYLSGCRNFGDFVRNRLPRDDVRKGVHFLPQRYFILDPLGRIRMDYVGRFETLRADFEKIAGRMSIKAVLPFVNRGQREPDYRRYYDEETKALVATIYRDDIQLLGYEF